MAFPLRLAWLAMLSLFCQELYAAPIQVHFKVPSKKRLISPYIYGFGSYLHENREAEGVWDFHPTIYRWGGNTSSRFNYKIDAWNSARDWFFRNMGGRPGSIKQFMLENHRHAAASMITLPMLGWVAKDRSSSSFPRGLFPVQEKYDGDAGNGQGKGGQIFSADPKTTSLGIDPSFVKGWVKQLKSQFGSNPHFYIMDNEPMLWHQTHRDVQREPMRYDSYLERYVSYARAVREADPQAKIVGPAAWGWMEMQFSAYDIEGPWNNWKRQTDRKAHGDQPFLEWFLMSLAKREKELGISLLDVLDVHYYPETDRWPGDDDKNPARQAVVLESTRSLWDRSYRDRSWIDEKIYLIPRLQELAERFKPGTPVSLGEYNFRFEDDAVGALVQAELLGIFGQTGLYAAHYWDYPRSKSSHRDAFALFRNYDGKGQGFASEWVDNDYGMGENLSVFAAQDTKKKRVTLVFIHKNPAGVQDLRLDLSPWPQANKFLLVSYVSQRSDGKLVRTRKAMSRAELSRLELPPRSMHLLEILY